MTLKKECCIKCHENMDYEWSEWKEQLWNKNGCVECPEEYIGERESDWRKVKFEPPEKCPFLLEHILTKEE